MNNLKEKKHNEIIDLVNKKEITMKDFIDSGICPTCFDNENNHILYGNKTDKMIYEDNNFECFLISTPRSIGHTAISTKKHYKDMLEIDDNICKEIYLLAKKVMIILKEVYNAESIYLCTMCDGPMNHFHIQLIPRYSHELRGSENFVKKRKEYILDQNKLTQLRNKIKKDYN